MLGLVSCIKTPVYKVVDLVSLWFMYACIGVNMSLDVKQDVTYVMFILRLRLCLTHSVVGTHSL